MWKNFFFLYNFVIFFFFLLKKKEDEKEKGINFEIEKKLYKIAYIYMGKCELV